MSIKLRKKPAALVATPDASYVQLFVDDDGLPKVKSSDGVVTQLSQSAVVTLVEQGSDPSPTANQLKIYSKDVAGNTEMFVVDSSGNEVQITDAGSLAGGAASALATTGASVSMTAAAPPTIYQSLVASSPTTAVWFHPFAGSLLSSGGTNPVSVSASADPTANQVLTAVDSTTAIWADPPGGLTLILASGVTIPSNTLSDITEFTFPIATSLDYYSFEFHLTISQSGSSGVLGLTVQPDALSFVMNAVLARSSSAVTYGSTASAGSPILDDVARAAGTTFECVITGGFRAGSTAPLVVRANRSAGTTAILAGSWGRVWRGTSV